MKNKIFSAVFLSILLASFTAAQTGGDFTIEKSGIASGGTQTNGDFTIENTVGQTAAGNVQGGEFTIFGGFITPPLAPPAASVAVSGRVSTANGNGLTNAVVVLTDSNGDTRTARTSGFGFYRFDDIEVGQTYIFTVSSRRYSFAPQIVTINDEINNLNFYAIE